MNEKKNDVPAVVWRLVKDPTAVSYGESGLPLNVDFEIATNDRRAIFAAADAIARQAVEARITTTLKNPAGDKEATQAERLVTNTQAAVDKLRRELTTLKAKHESLVAGDHADLVGPNLARAIGECQQSQAALAKQIAETEVGLITLRNRADERRQAVTNGMASIAGTLIPDLRAAMRERREAAKAKLAQTVGDAYATFAALELATERMTENHVRQLVAQISGVSLPGAPATPAPRPAVAPSNHGIVARYEPLCKRCNDVGVVQSGSGRHERCACQPPLKTRRPTPNPSVIVG